MIDFLNKQITNFTKLKYWKLISALFAPILIYFVSFPGIHNVDQYYTPFFEYVSTPFTQHDFPADSTYSKLTFRLLPILFVKYTKLNILGVIIWQFINGILLIYVFAELIFRISKSNQISFYLTLSLIFIYTGKVSFINFKPNFDSLSLIFYTLYFLTKNKYYKLIVLFLICWVDERAIIASSLLIIYDIYVLIDFEKNFLKQFLKLSTLIIPFLIYITLRIYLTKVYGLKTSTGGVSFKILATNLNLLPISTWQAFEGFWILIIGSIYLTLKKGKVKEKLFILLVIISVLMIVLTSNLVYDVSRSLVYLYPLLIICFIFFCNNLTYIRLLRLAIYSLLLCMVYPSYVIGGPKIEWMKPYFLNLIFQFFTNS